MLEALIPEILHVLGPGALPAAALLYVWWKLDHRILELEILFKALPCNKPSECHK